MDHVGHNVHADLAEGIEEPVVPGFDQSPELIIPKQQSHFVVAVDY